MRSVERRAKVRATGRLKASLEQACVATGDPVPAHIDEPFELVFMPEPEAGRTDEEIELGAEDLRHRVPRRIGDRSSAARSPTRWRWRSTPIRAAPAPMPRSRKRAS